MAAFLVSSCGALNRTADPEVEQNAELGHQDFAYGHKDTTVAFVTLLSKLKESGEYLSSSALRSPQTIRLLAFNRLRTDAEIVESSGSALKVGALDAGSGAKLGLKATELGFALRQGADVYRFFGIGSKGQVILASDQLGLGATKEIAVVGRELLPEQAGKIWLKRLRDDRHQEVTLFFDGLETQGGTDKFTGVLRLIEANSAVVKMCVSGCQDPDLFSLTATLPREFALDEVKPTHVTTALLQSHAFDVSYILGLTNVGTYFQARTFPDGDGDGWLDGYEGGILGSDPNDEDSNGGFGKLDPDSLTYLGRPQRSGGGGGGGGDGVAMLEDSDSTCEDGLDNDQDGQTDCSDDGCSGTTPCPIEPDPAENSEDTCNDTVDNDADGLFDCEDPSCSETEVCAPSEA